MTRTRFILPTVLLLLSCLTAARAQQTASSSKEADEALRQKAFDLLASVAGQISILQSPENRARLSSNIAESIWEHDEKLARALVMSVQEDINVGLRNQTGEDAEDRQRRMVFLQLRVNTVERIAKRDPELALAFFRNTELPPPPEESGNYRDYVVREQGGNEEARDYAREYRLREERSFELRLAQQIADNNPEIALAIARQSLAKEFSYDLISLLRQLNRKHSEQAQTLFTEIVDRLSHAEMQRNQSNFYFATSLARAFAHTATNTDSLAQLAKVFINAAEANGCNQKLDDNDSRSYFCNEIGRVLVLFDKVPTARNSLKQWQPQESDESMYSFWEDLNDVAQNGSVDEILALGAKRPELKETAYQRAFIKAQIDGDPDRARKILAETPEGPTRNSMLEMLETQEKMLAKFHESLKDIDRALGEMRSMSEKIQFLLGAAGAISQTDRKESIKLLNRANSLVETMRPGIEQLELQMILAIAYSGYNSDRGIVVIESLMPRLNELVNAAAKLDGYETHHLRDGEWDMSAEGPLGTLLTGLAQSAPYFAWCDFDRAVSVAGQFERPELRLMAQVKLAQSILAGRPKGSQPLPFPVRFNY